MLGDMASTTLFRFQMSSDHNFVLFDILLWCCMLIQECLGYVGSVLSRNQM